MRRLDVTFECGRIESPTSAGRTAAACASGRLKMEPLTSATALSPLTTGRRNRFPRAVFTRKLERLCSAFDETPVVVAGDRLSYGKVLNGTFRLENLWAVGSYARGASECGDLDLVLQYARIGGKGWPTARTLVRAALGTVTMVQYFSGTPEKNDSGVSFAQDAVLLWQGPGCNWRTRLAGITVDPTAGRAVRETDVVPIPVGQLDLEAEDTDALIQAWRAGRIRWRTLPLDLQAAPRKDAELDAFFAAEAWGKVTGPRVLPAIERAIRELQPRAKWNWRLRSLPRLGSIAVECAGRPRVPIEILDAEPEVSGLAVFPHPKGTGPHVLWLIERAG